MPALSQPQREELRFAVREILVNASTVALAADMILRRIERGKLVDFTADTTDVMAALSFLTGLGHVKAEPATLGATLYYQATAEGVLAHERGQ